MAEGGGSTKSLPPLDVTGPAHVVSERWRKWKRSFKYMVEGKGISDKAQCKSLLLHTAGEAVQDIFDTLEPALPANPADVFDQAVKALDDHFKVAVNVPYERHQFRQLCQKQGETVAQFVTRLQSQAVFCDFQDASGQIRDQLVQSILDDDLRQKMLETRNITLKDALDLAQKKGMSTAQAKTMRSPAVQTETGIHRVDQKKKRKNFESTVCFKKIDAVTFALFGVMS